MPLTAPGRRSLTPFEGGLACLLGVGTWLTVGAILIGHGEGWVAMVAVSCLLAGWVFPQATSLYANRFPARTGPAALSRLFRRSGYQSGRAGGRFGAAGRRGLGLAAIGLVMTVMFTRDTYEARGVQHDLAERGVPVEAVVTTLYYGRSSVDQVEVTYSVQGAPMRHTLELLGSLPSGLRQGSQLDVVYDPNHPSTVMLRSQVHGGTGTIVFVLLVSVAVLLAGLRQWWRAFRPSGLNSSAKAGLGLAPEPWRAGY
jgi:Protein of unknown function (DUF3592)